MRAIRFRGKDALTGAWVYGYYAVLNIARKDNHATLLGYDEVPSIFNDEPGNRSNGGYWHEIDPETRGQSTGLKDKNGVEIYEGDVVIQHGHGMNDIQGCVTYEPSSAMFVLSYETYGCMHTETLQSKKVYNDYDTSFSVEHTFEVIGNIHDRSATQGRRLSEQESRTFGAARAKSE